MKTITMLNQKGGVGKTSSCHHLSGALSRTGLRVLLIDNDPQASLTQGIFGPEWTRSWPPDTSVSAIYRTDPPSPGSLLVATPFDRVTIVPGSRSLVEANMRPRRAWGDTQGGLRWFVESVEDDFDVCLIDCPPNLHLCSWAALVGSNGVVVPLQAEDYGSQGIFDITAAIEDVKSADNPSLDLLGFLITMFDRRLGVHAAYRAELIGLYGAEVFNAVVPRAKDFVEAVAARMPVSHYKPKGAAAKSIQSVAAELLDRASVSGRTGRRVA